MLVINILGQQRLGGGVPHARTFDGITDRWFVYRENSEELAILRDAIQLVRDRVLPDAAVLAACNARFQRLGGVSFTDYVHGSEHVVVISRNPTHRGHPRPYYGATSGHHVTIAKFCFARRPRETAVVTTAATLVHELAHVAGAPGGESFLAEAAVRDCGFPDQFQRGLVGELTIPQLVQIIGVMV
jgi:hypothetical protein